MTNAEERPISLTTEGRRQLEQRLSDYTAQLQELRTPAPTDEARDTSDEANQLVSADDASRLADMITVLQNTLSRARPLESGPNDGVVRQGSSVVVRDDRGGEHHFKLLDGVELEADPEEVSLDSPMGRALLDRAKGTEITVTLPAGERRYTIVSVEPYRPTAS